MAMSKAARDFKKVTEYRRKVPTSTLAEAIKKTNSSYSNYYKEKARVARADPLVGASEMRRIKRQVSQGATIMNHINAHQKYLENKTVATNVRVGQYEIFLKGEPEALIQVLRGLAQ